MIVQYIGSDSGLQTFKTLTMGSINVTSKDVEGVSAILYEVSSLETLYKIPKRFDIPSYFYITTKDNAVITRIKEYYVSGIFFPPLKTETVLQKLKQSEECQMGDTPFNGEEYTAIRIKIQAKAENIPPLPDLAQQLIAITRRDSATIQEVTNKIKMDQGISSRVIKLINSPFYGVRQEISSIDRATVLLGFNSVRNIAMALSIDQYFQKSFGLYGLTGKALWLHSYKTACIAQEIAKEVGYDADSHYMGGLMHDIGKIVMADFLVKEVKYPDDERKQLGFDHAEIGAVILKKWSVIPRICDAVKNHHNQFADSVSAKIIYYANKIDNNAGSAESIIDEMGVLIGLSDTMRLKTIIIPFLQEQNGEI